MKRDAQESRELQELAELGRAARRMTEALTEALHDGLRLTVFATSDGVVVEHGNEWAVAGEVFGFDLHEALCRLADGEDEEAP